jgi:predicted PurR-regulated permease PerM
MPNNPSIKKRVDLTQHLRITGDALKSWLLAQIFDSLAIGFLWLIGLYLLKIPLAPLWALLAASLQFIPHLGPVLGMLGPVLAAAIAWADWKHPLYVLMLYAGIVVLDGFVLQPYLLKRTAKVPIWVSIVAPIVLGFVIPFWGVLLAPPLLAVIYAYKSRRESSELS